MFTPLGSIFTHKPRQAEMLDTRQGIRRHDPDHERPRKKKKESEEKFSLDTDDSAVVSIEALRVFLENFLKTQTQVESEISTPQQPIAPKLQEQTTARVQDLKSKALSSNRSAAINAYQHTAKTSSAYSSSSFQTPQDNTILDNADIRTIHQLLGDIKVLSERNVSYVSIERGDSFLESLVNAVAKLK